MRMRPFALSKSYETNDVEDIKNFIKLMEFIY